MSPGRFDVVVMGEALVELSAPGPFVHGSNLRMSFSGDALNAAAAAVAAGARVGLLTRLADDEIGEALLARLSQLGVSAALVNRVPGENGVYFIPARQGDGSRRNGDRSFVYMRRGSVAAEMTAEEVERAVDRAAVVVATGVTYALSKSCALAVEAAARVSRRFIFDPNLRLRLSTPAAARNALRRVLPHCELVVPSHPLETRTLLDADDPWRAAARCLAFGAEAAAVTAGADGVFLLDGPSRRHVPAVPASAVVDEVGAGDAFLGTVAARLALGDTLLEAVELANAAGSLAVSNDGGAGGFASLDDLARHLELQRRHTSRTAR